VSDIDSTYPGLGLRFSNVTLDEFIQMSLTSVDADEAWLGPEDQRLLIEKFAETRAPGTIVTWGAPGEESANRPIREPRSSKGPSGFSSSSLRRRRYGSASGFMVRIALLLCVVVSLAGSGAALALATGGDARDGSGSHPAGRVAASSGENEASARTDAALLLTLIALPAGAERSASEPAGDHGRLASPEARPATPNLLDDHAWWTLPGTPAQTLSYIRAHPPAGSTLTGTDSGATYGVTTSEGITFSWPPITDVLETRQLSVSAVALPGNTTGLRVDAQVVWVTPRPASETIPTGAHLLRISVGSSIPANQPHQRPLHITSTSKINAVIALLNALPAAQPGTRSCPADFGIRVRLAFYPTPRRTPSAIAEIDPQGCGTVQLTLAGKPQPPLESQPLPTPDTTSPGSLIQRIDRTLGVEIHVTHHPRG
jgi:hypothetical protein